MGELDKTNNYTDFYYIFFRNVLLVGIPLLIIFTLVLSSIHSSATGSGSSSSSSGTDSLTISISSACTLGSVVDRAHNSNVNVGTYTTDIGKTTITTLCNDGNGYSIYANGYSNNEEGNNRLINNDPLYSNYYIDTGLATSGLNSTWSMKLYNIPNDPSPTPPTIESAYNDTYGLVPQYWAKVAGRQSGTTDMIQGSSFTTTYAVYASSSQYAGTYVGQVKYALIHPNKNDNIISINDSFALHGKDMVSVNGRMYYKMQDMDPNICKSVTNTGEITATELVDIRDNNIYWVTKLADGNCWMTQNLDLVLETTPNKVAALTSENTDLNLYGSMGYDSNNGYSCSNPNTTTNCTASGEVITWAPERSTINFQNDTMTDWTADNSNPYSANKTDSTETGHASLGNYYNWTAAIASNNSSSFIQDTLSNITNNPKNSICPKGWRLPTISNQSANIIGSTNEFSRLNLLYNDGLANTDAGLIVSPLWFVRSGYIPSNRSLLSDVGIEGLYRSSTIGGSGSSYSIDFLENNSDNYNGSKRSGYSVRCVAR